MLMDNQSSLLDSLRVYMYVKQVDFYKNWMILEMTVCLRCVSGTSGIWSLRQGSGYCCATQTSDQHYRRCFPRSLGRNPDRRQGKYSVQIKTLI